MKALIAGERRVTGCAEGHGVGELGGARKAHGGAAFEVAGHHERHARRALEPVEERGHLVGLGLHDGPAVRGIIEDQPTDFEFADEVRELAVLTRAGVGRFAVESDEYQLSNFVVEGHATHPPPHRGRCFEGSGRGTARSGGRTGRQGYSQAGEEKGVKAAHDFSVTDSLAPIRDLRGRPMPPVRVTLKL